MSGVSALEKGTKTQNLPFSSCHSFNLLSAKYQRFILEYIKDYNGQKAWERCGGSANTGRIQASKLLTKPNIKDAISEILSVLSRKDIADVKELQEYWTQIKRQDISKVMRWTQDGIVFVQSSDEMPVEGKQLIKAINVKERVSAKGDWTETHTRVELHDPLRASELLGRSHGAFKDSIQHNVSGQITHRYESIIALITDQESEADTIDIEIEEVRK
jgi:phage terminase small subunit